MDSSRTQLSWATRLQGALLCTLYGLIAVALVLAFVGQYSPLAAILLGVPASLATIWWYFRRDGSAAFFELLNAPAACPTTAAGRVFGALGLTFFITFIIFPLLNWPDRRIFANAHYDTLLYHFSRIIQLAHTGSLWDDGAPYSIYPCASEIWLSLVVPLDDPESWFGKLHAVVVAFFYLTLVQLLRKSGRISRGASLGWASAICAVPIVFEYLGFVGKNDLLLHAATLSAVLHSPIGGRGSAFFSTMHLPGLAMSSMLAMSAKPTGLGIAVTCWALVVASQWLARRSGEQSHVSMWGWARLLLVMLPSVHWIVRNYVLIHALVTPDVMALKDFSVLSQYRNVKLYNWHWDKRDALLLGSISWAMLAYAGWTRRVSWSAPAVCLVLLGIFIITPASAWGVHHVQEHGSVLMYRYITGFVAYALVVCVTTGAQIARDIVQSAWQPSGLAKPAAIAASCVLWGLIANEHWPELVASSEGRARLVDCFPAEVDGQPYDSIYDLVRRTIDHQKICFDGQLPYFCHGPGLTNTLVRDPQRADYFVCVPLIPGRVVPEYVGTPEWDQAWELLRRDENGMVYARRQRLGAASHELAR